jgi:hypothetical protein
MYTDGFGQIGCTQIVHAEPSPEEEMLDPIQLCLFWRRGKMICTHLQLYDTLYLFASRPGAVVFELLVHLERGWLKAKHIAGGGWRWFGRYVGVS